MGSRRGADPAPEPEAPGFDPEVFRRDGRAVVDWVADYLATLGRHPVRSRVEPGSVRAQLPAHPPETGEPLPRLLADLDRVVVPGLTHWQHPRFFAYFPANASAPSILAELLSAGLGVQGMLWATSPAATELEAHVLDWLVELLGLPEGFSSRGPGGGVIQDSASSATLCALLAARERASDGATNRSGVDAAPPLTVYASAEAHSSVEKAVRIAGLGSERLRLVDVDDGLRLRADALAERIAADRAAGARPCLVVATVGTTSSGAVDPLAEVGAVCRREGLWLHVDAAWAGTAALCPEHRGIHDGLEHADSYCFNPHKWMLVNFDASALYVTDRDALVRALSILPEYLRNPATESGAVVDYRDWQVPLGRRFRALKLWFVLRSYGAEGLRAHVRRHVGLAERFADRVRASAEFALAAPVHLSLVCFRHRGGDELNAEILRRVNDSGEAYLSHARLHGRLALRLAVGAPATTDADVQRTWQAVCEAASAASAAAGDGPGAGGRASG